MKKTIKLMLATALLSFGCMSAFAAPLVGTTQYMDNGFKYQIKTMNTATADYTVSVSQNVYNTNGAAALVIPATVAIPVKGTSSNGVDVDATYTFKIVEIEANAFAGITKITTAQIGPNITTIGANAFNGCTNMAELTFDANTNVVAIADDAFTGTIFPVLDLTPLSKLAVVNKWFGSGYTPGVGDVAGASVNSKLTTVKFPGSLTTIAVNAFGGCEKLATVSFPATTLAGGATLTINTGAFHGTAIETLDLTEAKIVTLEKLFDSDNVTLKSVTMPKNNSFTTLAVDALANCIQLKTVDFSKSTKLATLNNGCLSNTIINTLDFTNCVDLTVLPATPFVNATTTTNKNLKTVILPWKTSIGDANKCPVTDINTAFANCEKLTTITNFDKSRVVTIIDKAFEKCISLTALTFPGFVANVNGSPFDGCDALATLTFKAHPTTGNTIAVLGNGAALYGATVPSLAALTSLTIEGNYTATITAGALNTVTALSSLTISKGKTLSGTIQAAAVKLAENANATVEFGDITGTVNTITGPVGVYKTTMTIGKYNAAHAAAMVSGTIDVLTINGTIDNNSVLTAAGQAEKIVFNKDVNVALAAPAAPNAVLTAVEFNGKLGNGATADIVPATVFNLTNAPILASVKFVPAAAPTAAIFNIAAFAAAAQGAAAKVELTTTSAVADLYGGLEANLYNVIFKYEAPAPVPLKQTVYGQASSTFYYGKLALDPAKEYAFPKETADGEQVIVYSAFVDDDDNTIYMDPLSIIDGQYVLPAVAAGPNSKQAVIVRVKEPQTTTELAVGYSAEIEYFDVTGAGLTPTMRYAPMSAVPFNALESATKLFSSDFIGTNFIGKTLYAMANPAKEGELLWKKISVDSYLPNGAVFVQTNESTAAELNVVWGNTPDEISDIIAEKLQSNNDIYNLSGMKLNDAPQKGIYIKNGKKFIVK